MANITNSKHPIDSNPFTSYKGKHQWVKDRTIFLTVHGSRAYGTNTPLSDIDIKGICIPPKEVFFGLGKPFEQAETNEPNDMVIYDLRKFLSLASNTNPNIIEVLFTDKDDWLKTTPIFEKLHQNRHLFINKKARHSFAGYAHSQLKRIKSHRSWLLNPMETRPARSEYGLSETSKVNKSDFGATDKLIESGVEINTSVMELFQKEKAYQSKLNSWKQYEYWKKTRNVDRSATEAKFGYDTKHAMHLVRLLKMCREILETGEVHVKRPDAPELLSIRNGEWSYEKLVAWSEEQNNDLDQMYKTSTIPNNADFDKINNLCQELIQMGLEKEVLS